MNPRNFIVELKRRDVYKVAVAYVVVAWLLVQQVLPFLKFRRVDGKTAFCGIWQK